MARPDFFLLGAPGPIGGANTEAWHTLVAWHAAGLRPAIIPTWQIDPDYRRKIDALGLPIVDARGPADLATIEHLAGSTVVSFCNQHLYRNLSALRGIRCRLVWVPCMTYLRRGERREFAQHGPPDAIVYQSQFQADEIHGAYTEMALCRGEPTPHRRIIRGAFDRREFPFVPRPHEPGRHFYIGRHSRPALDKWHPDSLEIYGQTGARYIRARLLGVDAATRRHIGHRQQFYPVDPIEPNGAEPAEFLATLHLFWPLNNGARENWPRAGLEAMAAGVPALVPNAWGWPEMIDHGRTGLLWNDHAEAIRLATELAKHEARRQELLHAARAAIENDPRFDPAACAEAWRILLKDLAP